MGRNGKIVVILLGLLATLAVAVAAGAVSFQMKERELRLAKEKELLLVKASNEDLEQRLAEVMKVQDQLKADLAKAEEQLAETAKSLAQELQVKDALAKSIDDRQREIDRLGRDLQQMKSERVTLVEQVTRLKTGQDELERQLVEGQQAKREMESRLKDLAAQPTMELEKVVVSPSGAPPAPAFAPTYGTASNASVAQGQVVVVNREYDFIVMNLGKNQGLHLGQEFEILRDGQILGRAKVEKIYEELSAAALQPGVTLEEVREGDLVRAI